VCKEPVARILVTDGLERAALATCRSLVAAGHDVHVIAPVRRSLAGVSRGVQEHVIAADPLVESAGFAAAIAGLARQIGARLLLPISDPAVSAILANAEVVPGECVLPFPSYERFLLASNKVDLLPLARAAGFGVPESIVVPTRSAVRRMELGSLLPGILKPHRSVVQAGRSQRRLQAVRFGSVEEGRRLLGALPEEAFPVLAQRVIEGRGVGFFALRWDGEVRAAFAHRRLRELPPSGGVSVYREAIALEPGLAAAGGRLLEALNWQGAAMIECKHEESSGTYYVIEVNARFWGSLQLAIDAGVDFPRLLVEWALGGRPRTVSTYRVGVRSRWLWGELDHVYLRVKLRDPHKSALGALVASLSELLRHVPGRDRCEILRLNDPRPFVVETLRRLSLLR
jgi:predicted ATP-grasp superfamily ATP-dependent carboligase